MYIFLDLVNDFLDEEIATVLRTER